MCVHFTVTALPIAYTQHCRLFDCKFNQCSLNPDCANLVLSTELNQVYWPLPYVCQSTGLELQICSNFGSPWHFMWYLFRIFLKPTKTYILCGFHQCIFCIMVQVSNTYCRLCLRRLSGGTPETAELHKLLNKLKHPKENNMTWFFSDNKNFCQVKCTTSRTASRSLPALRMSPKWWKPSFLRVLWCSVLSQMGVTHIFEVGYRVNTNI